MTAVLGISAYYHDAAAALYAKTLQHDPNKDIEPVIVFAQVSNVLVVNPSVNARSVKELIELAKSQPGKLTFVSAGVGTSVHMAGELFKNMAGVQMTHVPYKSSVAALVDLMAGRVDVMFDNIPSALPHIKSGKLRALAVSTAKRSPVEPDIPTVAESGYPGFDTFAWYGMAVPAGTPPDIVAKLNAEMVKAIGSTEVRDALKAISVEASPMSTAQFADFIKRDMELWARLVKLVDAKPD